MLNSSAGFQSFLSILLPFTKHIDYIIATHFFIVFLLKRTPPLYLNPAWCSCFWGTFPAAIQKTFSSTPPCFVRNSSRFLSNVFPDFVQHILHVFCSYFPANMYPLLGNGRYIYGSPFGCKIASFPSHKIAENNPLAPSVLPHAFLF